MNRTMIPVIVLSLLACSQSDFAGRAQTRKPKKDKNLVAKGDEGELDDPVTRDNDPATPNGKSQGSDDLIAASGAGGRNGTDPGLSDEEGQTLLKPVACTAANARFADAAGNCPEHYAAYTADDWREPVFGCCPLPAHDVLSKDPAQSRGGNCYADEVITGVSGGGVMCTKINTVRYRLGSPATTCYAGSGASGSSGAGGCGVPNDTFQALVSRFGSDACIGQPFGALIVGRTGKNCGDVTSSQLFFKDTGQPVPMY